MQRLFIAIDFPKAVNQRLIDLCQGIEKAKWIKPGQVHLTLRFIGDSHDDQTELLKLALSEIKHPAFGITLNGVGAFPPPEKHGRPKVLWVGVHNPAPPVVSNAEPLIEVQKKVEQAAQHAGFKPEPRPFHPHITLARFRKHPGKELKDWQTRHQNFEAGPIKVTELHLISSNLTPDGAIHRVIQTVPLT